MSKPRKYNSFMKAMTRLSQSIKNVRIIELAYEIDCDDGKSIMKKGSRAHVYKVDEYEDGSFDLYLSCPLGKTAMVHFKNEKEFDHYIIR